MFFSTFKFATRRFGKGRTAYLDPTKSMQGVCVGMIVTGRIGKEFVYQRSNSGYQRKTYKVSANPNSAGQAAQRSKFADAVAWAQSLTGSAKQTYVDLVAQPWKLPGYPHSSLSGRSWFNWAIHDYMATH